MTFHDKLEHLTEDRLKTVISRRAGLPPTAISNYLNKRHMPSLDIALRIARTLGVSLDWLADDSAGLPPVPANTQSREVVAA